MIKNKNKKVKKGLTSHFQVLAIGILGAIDIVDFLKL